MMRRPILVAQKIKETWEGITKKCKIKRNEMKKWKKIMPRWCLSKTELLQKGIFFRTQYICMRNIIFTKVWNQVLDQFKKLINTVVLVNSISNSFIKKNSPANKLSSSALTMFFFGIPN